MAHEHDFREKYRTDSSVYYECSCGASKLVSVKEAERA
jgi:hypothetical protein